jgi:hypothetical protein
MIKVVHRYVCNSKIRQLFWEGVRNNNYIVLLKKKLHLLTKKMTFVMQKKSHFI